MTVEHADTTTDGWRRWRDWLRAVAPDDRTEIDTLEADGGRYLGYVRVIARRRGEAEPEEYCWPDTLRSSPARYTRTPLLRDRERTPGSGRPRVERAPPLVTRFRAGLP